MKNKDNNFIQCICMLMRDFFADGKISKNHKGSKLWNFMDLSTKNL